MGNLLLGSLDVHLFKQSCGVDLSSLFRCDAGLKLILPWFGVPRRAFVPYVSPSSVFNPVQSDKSILCLEDTCAGVLEDVATLITA